MTLNLFNLPLYQLDFNDRVTNLNLCGINPGLHQVVHLPYVEFHYHKQYKVKREITSLHPS